MCWKVSPASKMLIPKRLEKRKASIKVVGSRRELEAAFIRSKISCNNNAFFMLRLNRAGNRKQGSFFQNGRFRGFVWGSFGFVLHIFKQPILCFQQVHGFVSSKNIFLRIRRRSLSFLWSSTAGGSRWQVRLGGYRKREELLAWFNWLCFYLIIYIML